MTVGHHFSLFRPLNNDERAYIGRPGMCLSCHDRIPEESLAVRLLHHAAEYGGMLPRTAEQHRSLVSKVLLFSAWGQVGGGLVGGFVVMLLMLRFLRRRRKSQP